MHFNSQKYFPKFNPNIVSYPPKFKFLFKTETNKTQTQNNLHFPLQKSTQFNGPERRRSIINTDQNKTTKRTVFLRKKCYRDHTAGRTLQHLQYPHKSGQEKHQGRKKSQFFFHFDSLKAKKKK